MTGVEVEPIRCWWRTSAGAVRVGESFSLVLTCAVLENESTTIVPDQSRLEPTMLQMPPFEVIGGTHAADHRTSDRRFFQYQYTLRLIKDDQFNKDVSIPQLQISYRVQSRVQRNAVTQGRDQMYVLPAQSIHVLSLVPADASDIRDPPAEPFDQLDARLARANVLLVVASVLFGLAGLSLLLTLAAVARRYRSQPQEAERLVPDRVVLREVTREFSRVRRERREQTWTDELAGRALAAFRIVGGQLLSERASQHAAGAGTTGHEGQLLLRSGWLRGTKVLVSGSVTADAVARELTRVDLAAGHRARLEQLCDALTQFTVAMYGRDGTLGETALDEVLANGLSLVRRLEFENRWTVRTFNAFTLAATELGSRVWSR